MLFLALSEEVEYYPHGGATATCAGEAPLKVRIGCGYREIPLKSICRSNEASTKGFWDLALLESDLLVHRLNELPQGHA